MDHRVPKVGTTISIMLAIGALITFLFLNSKFEGPNPLSGLGTPYELSARFDSTKTLPTKRPVLHKGVSVGRVNAVDYDAEADESVVTFTLDDDFAPIHEDAKLQIGERSLLGDAYLNLIEQGTDTSPELEPGDELRGVCPTDPTKVATRPNCNIVPPVNFDEALDFLDDDGRARLRSLIDTVAAGASQEGNDLRINDTVGGLNRTVTELRALTDALKGQEPQIADLVTDASTVVNELGAREQAVRTIVGAGRTTLDALAANTGSVQQGIEQLPPLLASGSAALEQVRPFVVEARPVLADLRDLAPDLAEGFAGGDLSLGPITTDLISIVEKLEPQRRALEQVGPDTAKFLRLVAGRIVDATPAALNAVSISDYLAPRSESIGAFFANTRSATVQRDAGGRYARFGVQVMPSLLTDLPQPRAYVNQNGTCDESEAFCYNAFPNPKDSLDNQPFDGTYPRIVPYDPPSPQSVLERR